MTEPTDRTEAERLAKIATPKETLERYITDSNIPKNEVEWWAHHEITRLQQERDYQSKMIALAAQDCARLTQERDAATREAEALREEVGRLRFLSFGMGQLVVDTGRYDGKPAVFIRTALLPGPVGITAAHENIPLDQLHDSEIVMTFATDGQAVNVADALVGSVAPDSASMALGPMPDPATGGDSIPHITAEEWENAAGCAERVPVHWGAIELMLEAVADHDAELSDSFKLVIRGAIAANRATAHARGRAEMREEIINALAAHPYIRAAIRSLPDTPSGQGDDK